MVTTLAASAVAVVTGQSSAAAAGFAPGNIVVARVGTGDSALSSAAAAVFLDEYTPAGTLVQSVPLPTTSGVGKRLTLSGSATSEGALTRSADGRYLTLAGYDADPGTASIASSTTTAVGRVVARVDGSGGVDTSTTITDTFSGNNIRGAVTDDGSRFWAVGANGGVRLVPLGSTGASTQINSANPTNIRVAGIAGGQLYVSTGSGTTGVYAVGNGLPTTGGQTPALTVPAASPYAFAAVDRDPAVPGVDTLYVADDSASGGILKFSSDGTTWTARGSFKPGGSAVRGLVGDVSGTGATLFATTTTNTLVKVDDTAASAAPIAATATTLRTAATNTALRGVAFAPAAATTAPSITTQPQDSTVASGSTATLTVAANGTGPLTYQWYSGTAGDTSNPVSGATSDTFTTPALTATTGYWVRVSGPGGQVDSRTATVTVSTSPNTPPTITSAPELALTVGDPDNPPAVRTVTVGDKETPASGLTVTVTSSDPSIVTGGATGTSDVRTLTFTPAAVGHATLTVTVSDGSLTASTAVPVAVSGALPAGQHSYYGASDASTAVDLGDGAMVVGDDETNVLRVYDRDHSRYPAQSIDVRAAGLALRDTDVTREIDIEAAARTGNTIFWVGSQGQNSSAKTRLNRQELFTTTVTGTGTGTTIALGGSYQNLRDDLVAWDHANGDALGLTAAAARAPEGDGAGGPTGVNIEGAEFAPDGTTLLLAFRGPLTADGKALVIPVTNAAALVSANPTTGVTAAFGTPLRWDLGGRGIREIRRNAANQYLIIAGPSDAGTGAAGEYKFYSWDGDNTHQPLPRAGSLDGFTPVGKPEAIVDVPNPLTDSSSAQVISDDGDTVFYGDGAIAKDLPLWQRKAVGTTVAIGAAPACTSPVVTIGSVEGTGDISPKSGQTVSVRGTVVADYEGPQPALRGFYLQDGGDGDNATSDGIFVFDNGANLVSNGDVVQVTGPVSEYQGQTQITASASGVQGCGTRANIAPVSVTLPVADPAYLERYEGMLVKVDQTLTVTEHFQLGRFGQVVVSAGGRLQQPTSVIRATDQAAVQAKQRANDLSRLIIDDADQTQNPDPIVFGRGGQPLSASNTLRGGDTVTAPVGVLTYTWAGNAASGNAFRLRPIGALGGSAVFDAVNQRPTTRPDTGAGSVHVAGANLLNFFNTFTGCTLGTKGGPTDCRGANNDAEYQRQLAKEVAALRSLDADVTGVMELQNNGYGSTSAIQALVNALNAAEGADVWSFVDFDAATGVVDVAGTDAIRAAQLYRKDRVTPVAGDTFVDQNDLFERRPVAQTYATPDGAKFTVVANHLKSKGSCPTSGPDTDQGDGQSCWNAHRTEQATELARWLKDTVVPAAADPDVLIVGDLNSYAGEDPIAVLENAGYVNLPKSFSGNEVYSYVFDGQWGYLDYALASPSLVPQVTGAAEAHTNADEPSVLDYNTEFKTPGQVQSLYAPDRFRTSDHDPVLVGIRPGSPAQITGTPGPGVVGQPYSFTFGLSTSAAVSLASGTLPAGLFLSEEGVLSGTPTKAGDSTFTVRATNPYGSTDRTVTVSVGKGASTTVLTASPNPVAAGSPVSLSAQVTGATGTVTFLDGANVLGQADLANGVAALQVPLTAGSHTITASYAGNDSLQGSVSSPVVVNAIAPVTIDGSLPDGKVGVAYTGALAVTGSPQTVTATGLPQGLTIGADGRITGTPTVAGTFTVTVTASNAVSTVTKPFPLRITQAATTTTVTGNPSPSVIGGTVRFTATVAAPAGLRPDGTIQFTVDGRAAGTPVTLVNGVATSQPITGLALGPHTIRADYAGSVSFAASTGTTTHTVQLGIKFLSPVDGSKLKAGDLATIRFQLVDANGTPIPALASALLLLTGRVSLSVDGTQTLRPTTPLYDPFSDSFIYLWKTAKRPTGAVTVTVSITYPDTATQKASTRATLI